MAKEPVMATLHANVSPMHGSCLGRTEGSARAWTTKKLRAAMTFMVNRRGYWLGCD